MWHNPKRERGRKLCTFSDAFVPLLSPWSFEHKNPQNKSLSVFWTEWQSEEMRQGWLLHIVKLKEEESSNLRNDSIKKKKRTGTCDLLKGRKKVSVQFNHSVVFNSLQPYGLQHIRPPCPCPNSNSWSLLKLTSIKSMMPSNHLRLCHPLLLLPSIFPSIRVFSNESAFCIKWPKYWSFSFKSPSNEHPGLISFSMD